MELAIGVYDAPLIQKQPILYLNPYKSNIIVFGGPMTGKTTFVKTFLVRLHEQENAVKKENIYIIDFGGNIGDYTRLGSVCACFDNSNEENIKRIFKTLERRLEENTKELGSENFYNTYLKTPEKCPIHLTLIIENINSFLADERYSAYQDRLISFCRDGLSKGLSVVLTANDIIGTNRLVANFGQKLAFEMPSSNYYEIFNAKVNQPMKMPGRGIVNIGSETYEFQCFIPFVEDEDVELQEMILSTNQNENKNKMVSFGSELNFENISDYCSDSLENLSENNIIVGLDYYEHKPVCLKISESKSVAIYGKRQFGKTNLLRLLIKGILKEHEKARIIYLDDGREQLKEFEKIGSDSIYLTGVDAFRDYLTEHGYGGMRSKRIFKNVNPKPPVESEISLNTPYTVFVLQSKSLYQASDDATYLMKTWIPEMIGNAEARNYLFIFSDVRNISAPEVRVPFNNNISAAFLLDNIGEFIADRGSKSVFGEMDVKELKAEYAKCSVGDGYFYDVDADALKKLKFIKND